MLVASKPTFACTSSPAEPRFGDAIVKTHDHKLPVQLNDLFAKSGLPIKLDTEKHLPHEHATEKGKPDTYFVEIPTPNHATDKIVAQLIHTDANLKGKVLGVYEQSPVNPVVMLFQQFMSQVKTNLEKMNLPKPVPVALHTPAAPVKEETVVEEKVEAKKATA